MDTIFSLLFGLVGVTSLIVFNRSRQDLANYLTLLFALAVVIVSGSGLKSDDAPSMLTLVLVIALSLGFLLSRYGKLRTSFWPWVIPVILAFIPVALGGRVFNYYDFGLIFNGIVVILFPMGVMLAALGSLIIDKVRSQSSDESDLNNSVSLLFTGVGVFAGFFLGSYFGILLVGLGMTLAAFFGVRSNRNATVGVLMISLIPYFLELGVVETIDLSLGETITGVFLGAFSVFFVQWLSGTNFSKVGVFGGIVSVLVLLNCFLFLGTQKTDLGGADLYIASFVGVALALTVVPTFRLAEAVVPLILTSGIITLPLTVQKEETMEGNPVESSSVKTEEKKEVSLFEAEGIPIDSIVGDYRINEKTVQLNFQLGPKGGVTKGAFKSFNGEVFINKDISKSLFSVELPFSKLTTFNKYRDESLAEEGYFNAAKFPLMSFASKKMIHKGAHYELEGNFTLLGVTKPLIVQLKYVGTSDVGNLPVLVGRSSIDRTQFGMKPDSKEGNIVDFEFRIELIR